MSKLDEVFPNEEEQAKAEALNPQLRHYRSLAHQLSVDPPKPKEDDGWEKWDSWGW